MLVGPPLATVPSEVKAHEATNVAIAAGSVAGPGGVGAWVVVASDILEVVDRMLRVLARAPGASSPDATNHLTPGSDIAVIPRVTTDCPPGPSVASVSWRSGCGATVTR